jgi:hypothetical protein
MTWDLCLSAVTSCFLVCQPGPTSGCAFEARLECA